MSNVVRLGLGVALALAGCKSEKANSSDSVAGKRGLAVGCATLLTPAEVSKACAGATPIINDAGTAVAAPRGHDVVHQCGLAIVWDGDAATRLEVVVDQFPTVERAIGAATFDRDLVTGSSRRELDDRTQLGTIAGDAPAKKLLGAKATLVYGLTANGRDDASRRCSDDGLIALGRLVASRLP